MLDSRMLGRGGEGGLNLNLTSTPLHPLHQRHGVRNISCCFLGFFLDCLDGDYCKKKKLKKKTVDLVDSKNIADAKQNKHNISVRCLPSPSLYNYHAANGLMTKI